MKMAKSTPRPPAQLGAKALQLLGRWMKISRGHLPLGAGCSCGVPAVSIRVADLERDVLDYLVGRHAAARDASSIGDLLKAIAARPTQAGALLADLERSFASFEEVHR